MSTLVSDAPSNFNAITLTQVMRADREMFSILASDFKGSLKAPVGVAPPLDELFERLMHDPRINVHLIAMPKLSVQPQKRPLESDGGKPTPGPKKPAKRIRPGEKPFPQLPDELSGLNRKTEAGKPFVLAFQHVERLQQPCQSRSMSFWDA